MASAERMAWGLLAGLVYTACGGSTHHDGLDASGSPGSASGRDGAASSAGESSGDSSSAGRSSTAIGGTSNGGRASPGGGASMSAGGSNSGGRASGAGGSSSGGQGGRAGSGSTACGSAGAGGSLPSSSADPAEGTVTPIWDGFCFATFSCDYTTASQEGPALTARAGRDYLLTGFGGNSAQLAYLTPGGPVTFVVKAGEGGFPFISNCQPDTLQMYTAAFLDLTIFKEPSLTNELCEIEAGATAPLDATKPNGFFLQSISDTDSVYKVVLNTFSERCGGAEAGYIAVPATMVLGESLFLVPFNFIQAPK